MRFALGWMMVAAAMVSLGCESSPRVAGREAAMPDHGIFAADEMTWGPGPASLPAGAEMAVLEGDPAEEGPVSMRFRLPDGYEIPPHWHPQIERVTVLDGTLLFGMSRDFDLDNAERLEEGSFFHMPPEMVHFAAAEGETVIQLNVQGPWEIVYVNPADDPRN